MDNIRYAINRLSRFVGLSFIISCVREDNIDVLKTWFTTMIEDRVTVVLEYIKAVSQLSHESVQERLDIAEQNINENINKLHGRYQTVPAQMAQLQDNMDAIIRAVNIAEKKVALLSVNIDGLRKAIGDTVEETRMLRNSHRHH